MNYVAVAKTTDVAPGAMKAVTVNGAGVLLANVDGTFYALAQKCPHMGADLCKGKLNGAVVVCPMHHAGFNVKTGGAVDPAKVLFLKMKTKDATSYAVKVENGDVLVGA